MVLDRVKCPKCGGPVNKVWFIQYNYITGKADFIAECWSGNLNKSKPAHMFLLRVEIDSEVVHADEIITISEEMQTQIETLGIDPVAELQNIINNKKQKK